MARCGACGSTVGAKEKKVLDPKGRADILAAKCMEVGLQMLERKHSLNGLVEWAKPVLPAVVKALGISKRRVF